MGHGTRRTELSLNLILTNWREAIKASLSPAHFHLYITFILFHLKKRFKYKKIRKYIATSTIIPGMDN